MTKLKKPRGENLHAVPRAMAAPRLSVTARLMNSLEILNQRLHHVSFFDILKVTPAAAYNKEDQQEGGKPLRGAQESHKTHYVILDYV